MIDNDEAQEQLERAPVPLFYHAKGFRARWIIAVFTPLHLHGEMVFKKVQKRCDIYLYVPLPLERKICQKLEKRKRERIFSGRGWDGKRRAGEHPPKSAPWAFGLFREK